MLKIKNNIIDMMYKNKINHLQLVKLLEKQGFSISPSNITRYTKEKCPSFSLEFISALCLSFNCTPNDIFTNEIQSKCIDIEKKLSCDNEIKDADVDVDAESTSTYSIEFDVAIGPTFDPFPFKKL